MLDSLGTIGSIVGVLFVVVTGAGVVVSFFRASYARAQIEALRGDRDDLLKRVEYLEHDNLRISDAFKNEQEKVRVLEKVVTGKEQLDHLQSTLDTFIEDDRTWKRDQRQLAKDLLSLSGAQRESEKA